MANAERERPNLFQRTIGSKRFEHFSRQPIIVTAALFGIILGPGAIIQAVNAIEQGSVAKAVAMGIQGTAEVGLGASVTVANIRSRTRRQS